MTQLIDLGKLRFYFAGEWNAATQYEVNDVVKYGGSVYVYTFTLAAVNKLPTDEAYWQLMVPGLRFQGSWDSTKAYRVGEGVAWGGTVFVAIADSTGSNPSTTPAKWSTFLTGIQFEGAYSAAVTYQAGDVVTYGAGTYVAKKDSLGNLPSDVTFWTAFVSGVAAQGIYNAATAYVAGDLVAYGGNIFRALGNTTGNLPSDATKWSPFLSGLNSRGKWDKTATYRIGDLVQYGGGTYRALGDVTANTAPTVTASWAKFLDGIAPRGDWATATEYAPNDVVQRGGSTYICLVFHASAAAFLTDLTATKWAKYNGGIRFRGQYAVSTPYLVDDVVIDGLNTYICTADFTSDTRTAVYQTQLTILAKGADYLPAQGSAPGGTLRTDGTAPFWADRWVTLNAAATVANGDAVLTDTSTAAFTATLPPTPAAYARVRFIDLAGTWGSKNLTIARNGTKINGLNEDLVCNYASTGFELLYTGATYGWKVL